MRKNALLTFGACALTLGLGVAGLTAGTVVSSPAAVATQASDLNFFDLVGSRMAPASMFLSQGSTENHFYVSKDMAPIVVSEFAWNVSVDLEQNFMAEPVVVTYAEKAGGPVTELFTLPAGSEDIIVEPPFPAFGLAGALTIRMTEEEQEKFSAPGDYVMSFPEGYFLSNGENVGAFTLTVTIEGEGGGVQEEYGHSLSPEANSVVESLSLITVTFDGNSVTYCDGVVASLSNDAGTYSEVAKYPSIDGRSLVFSFSGPKGGWEAGTYTFEVMDKQVCVNPGPTFDDSVEGSGNVAGFKATYVIEKSVSTIDFDAIATLITPNDLEATPANTQTQFGESGMGVVVLGLSQAIHPVSGNDAIVYTFKAEGDEQAEVLNVMNPLASDNGIVLQGAAVELDDEVADPVQTMTFLFAQDFDAMGVIVDPSQFEKYSRNGQYTLEIPSEVYALADGTLVNGFTLTYVFNAGGSKVALVDLEEADSYTVYTLDGKTVMVGASAAKLADLGAGYYVINGKKVRVVK